MAMPSATNCSGALGIACAVSRGSSTGVEISRAAVEDKIKACIARNGIIGEKPIGEAREAIGLYLMELDEDETYIDPTDADGGLMPEFKNVRNLAIQLCPA